MSPEAKLAARAERQHGVVDRRQALECGVTKSTLQRWVADGRTFAELSPEEKDAVSHRGRAFRALATHLAAVQG